MKLDIAAAQFAAMSGEQKKKYIANLFIKKSGAKPVDEGSIPVAVITAGLPGAGKTEFLDTLAEDIKDLKFNPPVRIDLDEIVSVYPDYTPKDYYKFRSQGNIVLERTIDIAKAGRYNMFIDGTFSGQSGASIQAVKRLLDAGYKVMLVYVYDKIETAWMYTQKRKLETGRDVDFEGFKESADQLVSNLNKAFDEFSDSKLFTMHAVIQKELRDHNYDIKTDNDDIYKLLEMRYNTNKLKEHLYD